MALADFARTRKVRMLGDNVLALMVDHAERIGSIFVPNNARQRPNKARVLAVGPGRYLKNGAFHPTELRPGDLVVVDPYKLVIVLADGALANAERTPFADSGEHVVVRERDCTGVLEGAPACPECGTRAMPDATRFSHIEEHWYCPDTARCAALWGRTATMTYHHTGEEVRALIGATQ